MKEGGGDEQNEDKNHSDGALLTVSLTTKPVDLMRIGSTSKVARTPDTP